MGNEGTTKGIRFPAEPEEENCLPEVVAQEKDVATAIAVRTPPAMRPTDKRRGRHPRMIALTTRATHRRKTTEPDQRTVKR